jgi:hypothetical protein
MTRTPEGRPLARVLTVCAAPLAWLAQLSANYAFTTTPCFVRGARLGYQPGIEGWLLAIGAVTLLVALAALWRAVLLYRQAGNETSGTGTSRTRFLAVWGIAFSGLFSLLIAINIAMVFGLAVCAG